jgi:sigma-B regulation protein RsbU (phosphoserine phosphatase)
MAAELARASRIQRDLLIKKMPVLPEYELEVYQEQCQEVGGDLYDLTLLPDGRLIVLIGDVSGKGLGAALLMANVLASFRTLYNSSDFQLLNLVREVSHQLCRYSSTGDFVTIFAGLLNPKTATFRFVNAGHNPGLLIKANGSLLSMDPSGLMAGAFEQSDWKEEEIALDRGDMICLYTDGLTEARNPAGDQFGEELLATLLKSCREKGASGIIKDLIGAVEDFVGQTPPSDDLTLIIIKSL